MSSHDNARRATFFGRIISLIVSALAAVATGWTAFQLQQQDVLPRFFYPLIFPLVVGSITGAATAYVAKQLAVNDRRFTICLAFFSTATVVVTESWCEYREYVKKINGQIESDPKAVMFRNAAGDVGPAGFRKFMLTRVSGSGGWWYLDVALTLASSVITARALTGRGLAESTLSQTPDS